MECNLLENLKLRLSGFKKIGTSASCLTPVKNLINIGLTWSLNLIPVIRVMQLLRNQLLSHLWCSVLYVLTYKYFNTLSYLQMSVCVFELWSWLRLWLQLQLWLHCSFLVTNVARVQMQIVDIVPISINYNKNIHNYY